MTARQPHETTAGYLAALARHIHVDPTPSAARAHVVRAAAEARGVRARWRRHMFRLALLAVVFATFLGTSGVAAAGHLPPTMQRLVADAARLMPVPVPIPYPDPSPSDTGMEPAQPQRPDEPAAEGELVKPESAVPPPEAAEPARNEHGKAHDASGSLKPDHEPDRGRSNGEVKEHDPDQRPDDQQRGDERQEAKQDGHDRGRGDRDEAREPKDDNEGDRVGAGDRGDQRDDQEESSKNDPGNRGPDDQGRGQDDRGEDRRDNDGDDGD